MPIDIVYGTQSPSPTYVNNFVQQSHKLMEQAYHRVREHLSAGHQQQKDIYDKCVHGKPYQEGDTVWLLDPVVAEGQSKEISPPLERTLPHIEEDN